MQYETWAETKGRRAWLRLTPDFIAVAGSVRFIELSPVGSVVQKGGAVGYAEFTDGNECEISSPIAGTVVAANPAVHLAEPPELLNNDPQGDGWLVELLT